MKRTAAAFIGCLCLVSGLMTASMAIHGTLTWGYDVGAWYQPYRADRPVGDLLSGTRLVSTNNGALALLFTPLALSSLLLFYRAITGKSVAPVFWAAVWVSPFLSFPIYAIVFVNLLYDSLEIRSAADPKVVMLLPLVMSALLYILPRKRK